MLYEVITARVFKEVFDPGLAFAGLGQGAEQEVGFERVALGGIPQGGLHGRDREESVDVLPGVGQDRSGVQGFRGAGQDLVEKEELVGLAGRITSYNVCYTKLLRLLAPISRMASALSDIPLAFSRRSFA